MSIKKTISGAAAIMSLGLGAGVPAAMAAEQSFITIGTGGVTGVYYPTGGAICRLVNQGRAEHGIRCSVESTGGSPYNLNSLRSGELEVGIAQSDLEYQALNGENGFAEQGPFEDLRAVFALHGEAVTIVARKDANIKTFEDLKGKRVNIGNPGSGQRDTMEVLMNAYGWTQDDFSLVSELRPAEHGQALCDNRIDAFVYVVGHPNGSIKEATTACEANLVEVNGEVVDKLIADNAYYRHITIPGGEYTGADEDVHTFGVGANLVTSAKVPEEQIYQLTKAVFDNFEQFVRLHPAFASLKKEEMVKDGLSAPLHSGAQKYYKEAGLVE
ncbi:TAXI family TRAP transporter solute-binding subunit [Oceanimonas sp. CHS3-5]|uniref:TAXI family TRAP transporter solute-binding subunit n=1 Tax=Oceanimonas sp. CHS3-5 TaxID=3068186 RepID=UPI00273FEF01|nr:TAXI family TRAP transporter solute-binding subunit [Oceanimonas sp. CHS3-5]MDP5291167.1 TAXI family TRAP transporter solute-binding subunit [Oceanimonas sp. CHS3-5]